MSVPEIPDMPDGFTFDKSISQILTSIAMEEVGLSHVINAEGEKIQYILGTLEALKLDAPPTIDEVIKINKSVMSTLQQVAFNQMFLNVKMTEALSAYGDGGGGSGNGEKKLTLTYDPNGGNSDTPPPATNITPNSVCRLNLTTKPTHKNADDGTAIVFIGWSAQPDTKIYAKGDAKPTDIITEINIGSEDATVYAVWGYDTNENGTADVFENAYTLTYREGTGIENTGPGAEANLLPHDNHALLMAPVPQHKNHDNAAVLFIGWLPGQAPKIYEGTDEKPPLINTVNITGSDLSVYAAYGYDRNGNGVADILEDTHSLFYDLNGGDGDNPLTESGLFPQNNHPLSTVVPTHAGQDKRKVIFLGWTETKDTTIYEPNTAKPKTIATINIGNGDVRVYALWGYANVKGIESSAAVCDEVSLSGTKWTVVTKESAADGYTYFMLVHKGDSWGKSIFSTGKAVYEGSTLQSAMTKLYTDSGSGIKPIAVVPNFNGTGQTAITTFTTTPAGSRTKDIFFALSRQDVENWIARGSCGWPSHNNWWTRTVETEASAFEWSPGTGHPASSVVVADLYLIPGVWIRVL